MDKNCSIHAKTPTYHVTLLNAYMHVHARTHMYPCVYNITKIQGNPLCSALHSRNTPMPPKSAFLSLNLPHEIEPQTASFRFW